MVDCIPIATIGSASACYGQSGKAQDKDKASTQNARNSLFGPKNGSLNQSGDSPKGSSNNKSEKSFWDFLPSFSFGGLFSNKQPLISSPVTPNISNSSNVVQRALSQLGTIGGNAYGEAGRWCAAFASWAFGGKSSPWGDLHAVADIKAWAEKHGLYQSGSSTKNVSAGDLVVWQKETCNGKSHVGIVKCVRSDGSIETVEGNSGNQVKTKVYAAGTRFDGFVKASQLQPKS